MESFLSTGTEKLRKEFETINQYRIVWANEYLVTV